MVEENNSEGDDDDEEGFERKGIHRMYDQHAPDKEKLKFGGVKS